MIFYPPICGSEINPPAKLYKLFTPDAGVVVDGDTVIEFQFNYYRNHFSFRWAEADDLQGGTEQPIGGLITNPSFLTIKFYGPWKDFNTNHTPDTGDIVVIDGQRWIVDESGCQKARKKSQVNLATIYVPLRILL